jgi:hypothetical protein
VKLWNTAGMVEVHVDAMSSGSYKRTLDASSDFNGTDASYGAWQLIGSGTGAPELGFIKLQNTAGTVEVHVDALKSGSYKRILDASSDFSSTDAGNGIWQLIGTGTGAPELGFIKLQNTGGTVEVHVDALSSGSYKRILDVTSDFSTTDASNGNWQLIGSGTGALELGFIKLQNTAGTVEVHVDALNGGSYQRFLDATSDFSTTDASNGDWQLVGSGTGAPELTLVKLQNTAGTIEVHGDALSGGSYVRLLDAASDFMLGDASNGAWQLMPDVASSSIQSRLGCTRCV